LTELARQALTAAGISVQVGATWTTDAPFRETQEAIDAALQTGILAVERQRRSTPLRRRGAVRYFASPV
jgi:hypothetical protein